MLKKLLKLLGLFKDKKPLHIEADEVSKGFTGCTLYEDDIAEPYQSKVLTPIDNKELLRKMTISEN